MDIVVGIDGSPTAGAVLKAAMEEARLRGATLHVVHALYVAPTWVDGMTFVSPNLVESSFEYAEAIKKAVWERVNALTEGNTVPWVQVDRTGYPPDQIVDYAKSIEARLIVVGSRGFGEFKSLLLGSTSHRVSHLSPCDVLIVKTQE